MSTRPHSLNDIEEPILKIRRDQHKRINTIVKDNAKFPIVAIGLVRDYIKNSSASQVVKAVTFDKSFQHKETETPTSIVVHTPHTSYEFQFKLHTKLETPTL
jgi:hypothetical protein